MAKFHFDHAPLLLYISKPDVDGPWPFKFLDVWLEDGGCLSVIKNSWVAPVCDEGDMSFRWFLKLKRLKGDLRDWNRNHFGDIFEKVKVAAEKLKVAQTNLEAAFSDTCLQEVITAQQELDKDLRHEEKYWTQKAHCKWLKEGDRNTAFFHNTVKQRRQHNLIQAIKDTNGVWKHDVQDICSIGMDFFKSLFTSDGRVEDEHLLDCILRLIFDDDNSILSKVPDMEEIHHALLSMPAGAASGPDGFSLSFYIAAWEIIKEDLFALVKYFYVGGLMHRSVSASQICLIPKVENPVSFA